ncbi:TPA: hypothetical protein CPT87_03515 [Candidatus Gastranaerophilales bacterium HUM_5]|nr:MAG TPA: hypothetical protein CPT99_03460 [Candidatus Gastranaerophilales bacterium HUM_4]DAA91718.1 MAG TPA: hypothetical protein CPT87_03515 [Candidatus Gastranaerophilales bacterium HUM_5]
MARVDKLFNTVLAAPGFGIKKWVKPSNINIDGLTYSPLMTDVVQISKNKFCVPSREKVSQLMTENGMVEDKLLNSAGKKCDDIAEGYVNSNNSIFLEELIKRFPLPKGAKSNCNVQNRMLYLQDINHNNFADKNEFLNKFLKDVDVVENLRTNDGKLLYTSATELYSIKAILQAKYNYPERYADLKGLFELYRKGLVPEHNMKNLFPEANFHSLPKKDIQKLLKGENYYPQFSKNISKQELLGLELGEAFSIDEKMFVKTREGMQELKIDKSTYEKLFPPVERYAISQNQVGNCGKISSWNAMIKNADSRIELYQMFEQIPDGVRVFISRPGYVMEFRWNDLAKLNTPENLQGGLGSKMLEYTYDINKLGRLDTVGNPRPEMITDILGVKDAEKLGFMSDDALKMFCSAHTNGIYIKNGGDNNLNIGDYEAHYFSTTDLSTGKWQNPWNTLEEVKLGFDNCSSGSRHDL